MKTIKGLGRRMEKEFVTVKGKKYYVENGTLDLCGVGITDIDEIKGLERLTSLKVLNLNENGINWIKGLENLTNLQYLNLRDNPIRFDESWIVDMSAQEIVRYCQDKKEGKIPFVKVKEERLCDCG